MQASCQTAEKTSSPPELMKEKGKRASWSGGCRAKKPAATGLKFGTTEAALVPESKVQSLGESSDRRLRPLVDMQLINAGSQSAFSLVGWIITYTGWSCVLCCSGPSARLFSTFVLPLLRTRRPNGPRTSNKQASNSSCTEASVGRGANGVCD